MTIVAACIPVLHPLYDRARTGLRKIFPNLGPADQGITDHRRRRPEGPDSPGFWSLKLRAIGLAESWWSSTAGRTSRRSGARGQTAAEEEDRQRPGSSTVVSGADGAVVVHSEGGGGQSDLEQRSRDLTIGVDAVVEMSEMQRGRDVVSGQGPGQDGSGQTTVVGHK